MSRLQEHVHEMLAGTRELRADFSCPDCGAPAHLRIQPSRGISRVNGTAWCETCELIHELCSIAYHPRLENLVGKEALVAVRAKLVAVCVAQALGKAGFRVVEAPTPTLDVIIADSPSPEGLPPSVPVFPLAEPFDLEWIQTSLAPAVNQLLRGSEAPGSAAY